MNGGNCIRGNRMHTEPKSRERWKGIKVSDDGVVVLQMRRSEVYTLELMREHMQTQLIVFVHEMDRRFETRQGKWIVKAKSKQPGLFKDERPRNRVAKQCTPSNQSSSSTGTERLQLAHDFGILWRNVLVHSDKPKVRRDWTHSRD
jgi:hypothetical protein